MCKLALKNGDLSFEFLPSGALYQGHIGQAQLNQIKGNNFDGSMTMIYLRVKEGESYQNYPILDSQFLNKLEGANTQVNWYGAIPGITYKVSFRLSEANMFFWDIELLGENQQIELIIGHDIGLATEASLLANEAYMSQYVDYKLVEDSEVGKVVCARQNQDQGGFFPYLELGSLSKIAHFSTDGYQFFGKSYKWTQQPEALQKGNLADEVYQYEFGYVALQTEKISLNGQEKVTFFGVAKESQPEKVTENTSIQKIKEAYKNLETPETLCFNGIQIVRRSKQTTQVLNGLSLSEEMIVELYPERKLIEKDDVTTLSFFGKQDEHIILQEKEKRVERSQGHIIMSGMNLNASEETLTSTSYMYGAFQSQVVLGNTSMNKFISNVRNPLNFFKSTGQRIYLKVNNSYQLLALPSLYEVGLNYSKWLYKMSDDTLLVYVYGNTQSPEMTMKIVSENNKRYDFLITQEILCDDVLSEHQPKIKISKEKLVAQPNEKTPVYPKYPELTYELYWGNQNVTVKNATSWFDGETESSVIAPNFVTLEVTNQASVVLTIQGSLSGEIKRLDCETFEESKASYYEHIRSLTKQFALETSNPEKTQDIARLNTIMKWYTHNMLVHYLVPHGLEQFGGAAWGTRDVCQGPVEFFMATQNFEVVKEIILTLYSHQFEETGNWPQWFMFDEFKKVNAGESHGDIIVWPLKVVGDYLLATNDFSILDEVIPYMSEVKKDYVLPQTTLLSHMEKAVSYIKNNFLQGTSLSCYGDGDWDDTLQPFDSRLKKDMASTWTVALTYQTLGNLSKALKDYLPQKSLELRSLVEQIEGDYQKVMRRDKTLPGFVLREGDSFEYIVHPEDKKTGINYRLLPMTRSMISELLNEEEVRHHLELIQEHLLFPDGVHLMNQPANYDGGVSQYFKRAEQAANFGREVGLQYVHAHIRYGEAMAKIGDGKEAWRALSIINPILIDSYVPNAEARQSNAYFSSSDGKFNTRYEAALGFGELKTGERKVKGGWRIYSSGPGIYINQLVSSLLGVRIEAGNLVLDPVIDKEYGTLKLNYHYFAQPIEITYYNEKGDSPKGTVLINGRPLRVADIKEESNRYRDGGIIIPKELLAEYNNLDGALKIEYYM